MKKTLINLSLVIALASLAGGATFALFSAQDDIPGNTISAGGTYLDIRELSGNKPIDTDGMVPGGWTPDGRAVIFNHADSLPMNIYMYVSGTTGAACDKTNLKVMTGFAGGDETANILYEGPLLDIVGEANRFETTISPPFDVLDPNTSQVIHQMAQLDETAGNEYQDASCVWDEIVVGESIAP